MEHETINDFSIQYHFQLILVFAALFVVALAAPEPNPEAKADPQVYYNGFYNAYPGFYNGFAGYNYPYYNGARYYGNAAYRYYY